MCEVSHHILFRVFLRAPDDVCSDNLRKSGIYCQDTRFQVQQSSDSTFQTVTDRMSCYHFHRTQLSEIYLQQGQEVVIK